MKKCIWLMAMLLVGLAGCELLLPPLPLPDATHSGVDKAGFRIGQQVIVPKGGVLTKNFGHNVQSNRLYFFIKCNNERRGLNYDFCLSA